MEEFKIKQHFSSVKHPQANDEAEAANKILVTVLKKRLEEANGNSIDELLHVLWVYCTTPQLITRETP